MKPKNLCALFALALFLGLQVWILVLFKKETAHIDDEFALLDVKIAALDSKITGLGDGVNAQGALFSRKLDKGIAGVESKIGTVSGNLAPHLLSLSSGMEGIKNGVDSLTASAAVSAADGNIAALPTAAGKEDQRLPAHMRAADSARAAYAAGHFADAEREYGLLAVQYPEETAYLLGHALSLYRLNPADSRSQAVIIRELSTVIDANPENAEALEVMGLVRADRQEWLKALECFSQLCKVRPGDAAAFRNAAECAYYSGDAASALANIERAAALAPGDRTIAILKSRIEASETERGGSH